MGGGGGGATLGPLKICSISVSVLMRTVWGASNSGRKALSRLLGLGNESSETSDVFSGFSGDGASDEMLR